jgi:hypothetical protein
VNAIIVRLQKSGPSLCGPVTDYWNPEQHAASDDFCQPL